MERKKQLTEQPLSQLPYLKVHGRTAGRLAPLVLFWTGSAIELNVTGSELWIEAEAAYDVFEPWISILVNDVPVSRLMITEGRHWICVFRGMNADKVKNVRIVKDIQAMSGDPGCSLKFHAARSDGWFYPVKERPYKLEIIGDSITSGEGAIGARQEEDWIPMWFSAVRNYASITANMLNAEYRILSQSGWGVLTSWDNNPHCNLADGYEKICGVLKGEKNEALGALEDNDFSSWQPDVIVVNLGTNDAGAFRQPEWRDEATGESHKQHLNEDGSYNSEDLKKFENAITCFLGKLRRYNREAQIVWAYGMLGIPMMPAIYRGVDAYIAKTGDKKVSVFQLPDTAEETKGARSHPGVLAHEKAAKELAGYIAGILTDSDLKEV